VIVKSTTSDDLHCRVKNNCVSLLFLCSLEASSQAKLRFLERARIWKPAVHRDSPTRQRSLAAASFPSPHPLLVARRCRSTLMTFIFYYALTPLLLDIHERIRFPSLPSQPAFPIDITQHDAGGLRRCAQSFPEMVIQTLYPRRRLIELTFFDHIH